MRVMARGLASCLVQQPVVELASLGGQRHAALFDLAEAGGMGALLLAGDIEGARQGFRQAIHLLEGQGAAAAAEALRQQASTMVKLED